MSGRNSRPAPAPPSLLCGRGRGRRPQGPLWWIARWIVFAATPLAQPALRQSAHIARALWADLNLRGNATGLPNWETREETAAKRKRKARWSPPPCWRPDWRSSFVGSRRSSRGRTGDLDEWLYLLLQGSVCTHSIPLGRRCLWKRRQDITGPSVARTFCLARHSNSPCDTLALEKRWPRSMWLVAVGPRVGGGVVSSRDRHEQYSASASAPDARYSFHTISRVTSCELPRAGISMLAKGAIV